MTDDYKQSAIRRRDERHTKLEETTPGPARHKDKKRWCKGKVGREHVGVCMKYDVVKKASKYTANWRVLVCTGCGRELDIWYGGKKSERPEWVK